MLHQVTVQYKMPGQVVMKTPVCHLERLTRKWQLRFLICGQHQWRRTGSSCNEQLLTSRGEHFHRFQLTDDWKKRHETFVQHPLPYHRLCIITIGIGFIDLICSEAFILFFQLAFFLHRNQLFALLIIYCLLCKMQCHKQKSLITLFLAHIKYTTILSRVHIGI